MNSGPQSSVAGPVRMRLTRMGFHFVFVTVFTILGSVIRDLNLLTALSGLLIGVLIVQWRIGRSNLMGLQLERQLPSEIIAGQPFYLRYPLMNNKVLSGSWNVRIEEQFAREGDVYGREVITPANSIASQSSSVPRFACRLMQRGRYRLRELNLVSEFPFGLMHASRSIAVEHDFTVYPEIGRLTGRWQAMLARSQGSQYSYPQPSVREGEFYGLRSWRNGDRQRWIHWRSSAKLNELAVCQFEQHRQQRLAVLVDLNPGENDSTEDFERLISFAATVANESSRDPLNRFSMALSDGFAASSDRDRDVRKRILGRLAVAQPQPGADLSELMESLAELGTNGAQVAVLSLRTRDAVAAGCGLVDPRVMWVELDSENTQSLFVEADHEC